jgi:dephospho-CoA kinase
MKLIGIIGNIGAGKSYISNIIEKEGHYVYNVDDHLNFLQETDSWLMEEIANKFGYDIYDNNKLNRKQLAKIVFNNPTALTQLESMVKGPILSDLFNTAYKVQYDGKFDVMFIENAMMISSGMYKYMDNLIFVKAPKEIRKSRVMEFRNYSATEFDIRNDRQLSVTQIQRILEKDNILSISLDTNRSKLQIEKLTKLILKLNFNL